MSTLYTSLILPRIATKSVSVAHELPWYTAAKSDSKLLARSGGYGGSWTRVSKYLDSVMKMFHGRRIPTPSRNESDHVSRNLSFGGFGISDTTSAAITAILASTPLSPPSWLRFRRAESGTPTQVTTDQDLLCPFKRRHTRKEEKPRLRPLCALCGPQAPQPYSRELRQKEMLFKVRVFDVLVPRCLNRQQVRLSRSHFEFSLSCMVRFA